MLNIDSEIPAQRPALLRELQIPLEGVGSSQGHLWSWVRICGPRLFHNNYSLEPRCFAEALPVACARGDKLRIILLRVGRKPNLLYLFSGSIPCRTGFAVSGVRPGAHSACEVRALTESCKMRLTAFTASDSIGTDICCVGIKLTSFASFQ